MKRCGVRREKEVKPVPTSEHRRQRHGVEVVFPFKRFDAIGCHANVFLDCATKRATVRTSPSVVSLISRIGEKLLFICSGTVIRSEENNGKHYGTVLTAATLVRCSSPVCDVEVEVYLFDGKLIKGHVLKYDFLYNIAVVMIISDAPFSVAVTRSIDCRIEEPVKMSHNGDLARIYKNSFLFQRQENPPESGPFNLSTEEVLIALGRDYKAPYDIMAAPGQFSFYSYSYDYMELFKTSCRTPLNGIGGPLINQSGEVIGMNFYHWGVNLFIPMNIVFKCLEHLDSSDVPIPRPWIGVNATNVYRVSLGTLRLIKLKFGETVKGIRVDMPVPGSPAYSSGIRLADVILKCDGNFVGSFSEIRCPTPTRRSTIKAHGSGPDGKAKERSKMPRLVPIGAIVAALSAIVVWSLLKQLRQPAANQALDFHKLSFQWPPSTCATMTCIRPYKDQFTIHGLWPQYFPDREVPPWAQNRGCTNATPVQPNVVINQLRAGTKTQLTAQWPNLRDYRTASVNEIFW